jgi:hypothetical protein
MSLIDIINNFIHGHPIKNYQSSISYEESRIKWGDVAEYIVVIG